MSFFFLVGRGRRETLKKKLTRFFASLRPRFDFPPQNSKFAATAAPLSALPVDPITGLPLTTIIGNVLVPGSPPGPSPPPTPPPTSAPPTAPQNVVATSPSAGTLQVDFAAPTSL